MHIHYEKILLLTSVIFRGDYHRKDEKYKIEDDMLYKLLYPFEKETDDNKVKKDKNIGIYYIDDAFNIELFSAFSTICEKFKSQILS